jgi:DNA topoisomerase-1
MTTKDYCYSILLKDVKDGKDVKEVNPDVIRDHLEALFRNKKFKDDAFAPSEKLPIDIGVATQWKTKKSVCLDIKTRAKPVRARIQRLLRAFGDADLVINADMRLVKPVVNADACDFDRFKQAKGAVRWNTLEHNGPYFKHLYEPLPDPLGVGIIYDGQKYALSRAEEDAASFYAKRIITEEKSVKKYLDKKEFNDNFFKDFKTYFTADHKKIFKDFKKFNFTPLVKRLKEIKEQKEAEKREKREEKERLKREREKAKKGKKGDKGDKADEEDPAKKRERIEKLEKKLNFSFAYVNGVKKDIRNSAVELPGLYVGSGNVMTNKGKIKQLYYPKDVTINVTDKKSVPVPPPGHKWGAIVHDKTANWTARYTDKTTGKNKYILLAETGDLLKFEKARKLNHFIDVVDNHIERLLKSKLVKDNQIGCALYLIKEYGIRVGNECEDDQCDSAEKVVGATTLMVQNVTCNMDPDTGLYHLDLSFKGKDSVSYDNTLDVSKSVYDHMVKYTKKSKKPDDNVFDEITSSDVNKYLKSIDKDFSAKVFRTRLASSMMYEGLKELDIDDDATEEEKIAGFNDVNRRVAIKLNHKKGLTDAAKEKLKKDQEKINELKKKMKAEDNKTKKEKLKAEIKKKEADLSERDKSKEIALDTSKKNYIDPRIVKAWAEYVNLGGCNDEVEEEEEEEKVIRHCVDKVYTKAHMKHFRWAIEDTAFDEDWDYSDTQLDCMVGDDLQPDAANPEKKPEKKTEKKPEKKSEKKTKKTPEKEKNIKEKLKGLKKINKDSSHFVKCVNKISKEFDETTSTVEQEFDKLREIAI